MCFARRRAAALRPIDAGDWCSAPAEPIIRDADAALERGDPTALTSEITAEIARELRERFARVKEARKHKDESIAAGRVYVEAYVAYVHYVEIVHTGLRAAVHEG